jgi:hypothetical protein
LLSDAIIRYQYVYTVQSYTWLRNEQSISVITVNLAGKFPGLSLENLQNCVNSEVLVHLNLKDIESPASPGYKLSI